MKKFDGIVLLTDLDGTLLYNAEMPENNRHAIKYFTENGGIFSVATGRAPDFIKRKIPYINAPVCALNGALIYDLKRERTLKEYFLPSKSLDAAREISACFNPIRINVFSFTENSFINPKPSDFDGFSKKIHKIVFIFDSEEMTVSAKKCLTEKYSDTGEIFLSWNTGLEIIPKDGGKGKCLEFIKQYVGAKTAVGAGDYENDFSLLSAADIACAPSDAHEEILKIADFISVSAQDGAIDAIIKMLDEKISKGIDL